MSLCGPESLYFFNLQHSWTGDLKNHKPTNLFFSNGPKLQSGLDNVVYEMGTGHKLRAYGCLIVSLMKEVKKQNVCDMGYISNLLIYHIHMGFNLNLC